jgi:hypothetical protein
MVMKSFLIRTHLKHFLKHSKIKNMIPTVDFTNKYPDINITTNYGIQDQFVTRIEMFVPNTAQIDASIKDVADDACYALHYFGGRIVATEITKDGTMYHIDAWKD